jgi:four helix bundle protein
VQDFRKLAVWQRSHQLALDVYARTASFPKEELYGLTSQLRRASTSVPANIAEGCGRGGGADLARFLEIAMGSASELEYHLLLARDLAMLPNEEYDALHGGAVEVKRMLTGLIGRVRGKNGQPADGTARRPRTDN